VAIYRFRRAAQAALALNLRMIAFHQAGTRRRPGEEFSRARPCCRIHLWPAVMDVKQIRDAVGEVDRLAGMSVDWIETGASTLARAVAIWQTLCLVRSTGNVRSGGRGTGIMMIHISTLGMAGYVEELG
jgi:hypothetical protein